jgi:6-phosphogluconolactonase (cycloisomerase 2 family)
MPNRCFVVAGLVAVASAMPAVAQQAHVNIDWNPHKNTQNLTPYGATLISPEVKDDRTVTFRLKAPDAKTVALTGGPILLAVGKGNTPIPFEKGTDGVWTLTVGPLKPNL